MKGLKRLPEVIKTKRSQQRAMYTADSIERIMNKARNEGLKYKEHGPKPKRETWRKRIRKDGTRPEGYDLRRVWRNKGKFAKKP